MLICFSRIVDYNVQRKYHSNIPLGGADDNFNRRIIEGLEQNGEKPILINFMPYHSFPSAKFLIYKREVTKIKSRITINSEYVNLSFFKVRSLRDNIVKEVEKIAEGVDEKINIVIYDLYDGFLMAALKLKQKYPNIKTVLIVPSIPTIDVPRRGIKGKLYKVFAKRAVKMASQMDSFVFLTKYMNEVLNNQGKPFVVIEGVAPDLDTEEIGVLPKELSGVKYVLYSGRLDKIYGIDKLVMCFLDNNIQDLKLVLCGVGDCENFIKESTGKTDNIIYLGFLKRPELNVVQKNAVFLINTRSSEGEYTRYSFPSKTMEYLVSGKPSLMFKLPGIPDEYDQFINYISQNTISGIKDAVTMLYNEINEGNALEKAAKGYDYAVTEKTPRKQSEKIIQMLSQL